MDSTPSLPDENDAPPRPRRGFAAWDPEKLRATASKGGKAAQAAGVGHRFTSDEAKRAGSKGGKVCHENRRARGE